MQIKIYISLIFTIPYAINIYTISHANRHPYYTIPYSNKNIYIPLIYTIPYANKNIYIALIHTIPYAKLNIYTASHPHYTISK